MSSAFREADFRVTGPSVQWPLSYPTCSISRRKNSLMSREVKYRISQANKSTANSWGIPYGAEEGVLFPIRPGFDAPPPKKIPCMRPHHISLPGAFSLLPGWKSSVFKILHINREGRSVQAPSRVSWDTMEQKGSPG